MNHSHQPMTTIPLLFAAAAALAACAPSPTICRGPDKDRGGALHVGLEAVVSDELNPDEGDMTDWKSFAIPAPGVLTVQVSWDRPEDIEDAVISVHDKDGTPLASVDHTGARQVDEVVVQVEQGYYYLELFAEGGRSSYSVVGRHTVGSDAVQPVQPGAEPGQTTAVDHDTPGLIGHRVRIAPEPGWQVEDILDEGGHFTSNGYELMRIEADGRLVDARGVHMLTLEADGSLTAHDKMVAPFVVGVRILADGTFTVDDEPFYQVDDSGAILAYYKDKGMRPTGRTLEGEPEGRRAAMLAWVYLQALERAAVGVKVW